MFKEIVKTVWVRIGFKKPLFPCIRNKKAVSLRHLFTPAKVQTSALFQIIILFV